MHHNTLFFSREEEDKVLRWKSANRDTFNLLLLLGGSGIQKVFPTWIEGFCRRLIKELPKLKIFILGDKDCKNETWECERTIDLTCKTSFRQALHMTKYADYVLGPDSGLLCGAGMFGTPKTILFTHVAKDQLVKYHENDFSLQSKAECSPCYVLAHSGQMCPKEPIYNIFPVCTHMWDVEEIFNAINLQYMGKF